MKRSNQEKEKKTMKRSILLCLTLAVLTFIYALLGADKIVGQILMYGNWLLAALFVVILIRILTTGIDSKKNDNAPVMESFCGLFCTTLGSTPAYSLSLLEYLEMRTFDNICLYSSMPILTFFGGVLLLVWMKLRPNLKPRPQHA